MFTKASIVAFLASVAAAQHAPSGKLEGNAIYRPLNEVVPACEPFTITWEPTSKRTVSLILLRGPSTNVVPLGAPLAVSIPNSGTFSWTPASTLEADQTHYGLQIIEDETGDYQYSTQFGISKEGCVVSSVKATATGGEATATITASVTGGVPTASVIASVSGGVPTASVIASVSGGNDYGNGYPVASSSAIKSVPAVSSAVPYPTGTPIKSVGTSSHVASTGAPAHSTMIIQPTGAMTVPESLRGSATSSSTLPESTGAASGLKAGLGLVGAAAAAVFMF